MDFESKSDLNGVPLLIVDDDPDILSYLKTLSSQMQCSPIMANNGEDALRLFNRNQPGVVLLDYRLPDMTGGEVLRKIKRAAPVTQVIMITAYGRYELVVKLLNDGACDYLKKPLKDEQVIQSVKKAYSRYHSLSKGIEKTNILIADENKASYRIIKNELSSKGFVFHYAKDILSVQELFMEIWPDIIILDADFCGQGGGFECMEKIKDLPFTFELIITANRGTEMTAIEALKRGASSFIRKPDDMEHLSYIMENTLKSLNLKRLFNLKMREFNSSRDITVKVTNDRSIELSLFSKNSRISSSFGLRLLDNIPLSIAVIDEDFTISYKNRFFRKHSPDIPDKLEGSISRSLSAAGISDVSVEALKKEVKILLEGTEDIETVILGRMEFLTLTSLKLIDGGGCRRGVLLIIRGS